MKFIKSFTAATLSLMVCISAISAKSTATSTTDSPTYNSKHNSISFSEFKSEKEIEELLTSYSSVFVLSNTPIDSGVKSSKNNSLINSTAKLVLTSYYYFKMDDIIVTGELYTSSDISENDLYSEINKLQAKIESGEIIDTYKVNTSALNLEFVNVTGDWEVYDIKYISCVMDDNGIHYGDFAEWRSIYKLTDSSYNEYYAFINESYIAPNPDKTDYRTQKIIYQFTPDVGGAAYLRNYAPKMKSSGTTINYSVGISGILGTDGQHSSGTIDASYTTLSDSPIIYNSGNMAQNYAEIQMIYQNTFDNSGEYYLYNTAESYQSSTFLVLVPSTTTNDVIIHNDRIVGIQRDSVLINKLVDFEISAKITIDR